MTPDSIQQCRVHAHLGFAKRPRANLVYYTFRLKNTNIRSVVKKQLLNKKCDDDVVVCCLYILEYLGTFSSIYVCYRVSRYVLEYLGTFSSI